MKKQSDAAPFRFKDVIAKTLTPPKGEMRLHISRPELISS
jgi:hypothetical protein